LALILGVVAAGLIVAYLSSRDSGGGEEVAVPTLSVAVAAEDIAAGKEITDSMVELKALPETAVISNAATAKSQVVGQTLRYPVAKGEQLSNLRLVDPTQVQALSFQIPEGMRGFTIPVSVNNSPAALLAPGDFVDVLLSVDLKTLAIEEPPLPAGAPGAVASPALPGVPLPPEGEDVVENPRAAVTLLQNVQVLTVQREYVDNGIPYEPSVRGEPPDSDSVSYVTMALTPEQAQFLWLALQEGQVTVTLRAFGDDKIEDLPPVTQPLRISATNQG
jgi:Flp pilus assembly protein CpaB